jgi:hypothetical protein
MPSLITKAVVDQIGVDDIADVRRITDMNRHQRRTTKALTRRAHKGDVVSGLISVSATCAFSCTKTCP